jgi:two-component system, LytTR family, sensor kinase
VRSRDNVKAMMRPIPPSTEPDDPASARRLAPHVSWRVILLVWSIPALADLVDVYVNLRMQGVPVSVWGAALRADVTWLYWALITPAIFRLGAWLPIRRPLRASIVAAQVALAVTAGLLQALAQTVRTYFLLAPRDFRADYVMAISDWLPISIVIYGAVLGAGYAIDSSRRYREQELRASELSTRLVESELAMLRAQLHPHFLFNALNAGVSLVRANEPEAGVRVLTHLSDLLRQMLRGDAAQEVTVGSELEFLRSYLEIEQARFRNRLSVSIDVDPALLDAIIPSLVLQPLVENAIRHGIGPRDAPGHVAVRVAATNGSLEMWVVDDGLGLPAGWTLDAGTGVGLRNTKARLERLYGAGAALAVGSRPGGGAEVFVRLPLRR